MKDKTEIIKMLKSIEPKVTLTLKPGEIKRLDDNLIVEKTVDGKIVFYEIINERKKRTKKIDLDELIESENEERFKSTFR